MSRTQEEEGQETQREIYSPFYYLLRPAPVDVAEYVFLNLNLSFNPNHPGIIDIKKLYQYLQDRLSHD